MTKEKRDDTIEEREALIRELEEKTKAFREFAEQFTEVNDHLSWLSKELPEEQHFSAMMDQFLERTVDEKLRDGHAINLHLTEEQVLEYAKLVDKSYMLIETLRAFIRAMALFEVNTSQKFRKLLEQEPDLRTRLDPEVLDLIENPIRIDPKLLAVVETPTHKDDTK